MSFCDDPNYHSHSCPGFTLERIADTLERIADTLERIADAVAPTLEQQALRRHLEDEDYMATRGPQTGRGVRR